MKNPGGCRPRVLRKKRIADLELGPLEFENAVPRFYLSCGRFCSDGSSITWLILPLVLLFTVRLNKLSDKNLP